MAYAVISIIPIITSFVFLGGVHGFQVLLLLRVLLFRVRCARLFLITTTIASFVFRGRCAQLFLIIDTITSFVFRGWCAHLFLITNTITSFAFSWVVCFRSPPGRLPVVPWSFPGRHPVVTRSPLVVPRSSTSRPSVVTRSPTGRPRVAPWPFPPPPTLSSVVSEADRSEA